MALLTAPPRIGATRSHGTLSLKRMGETCVVVSARGGFALTFRMDKDRDDVALWRQAVKVAERDGKEDLARHIEAAIKKAERKQ